MDKSSIGKWIRVQSYKHDGSLHRTWDNVMVIDVTDDYIVTGSCASRVVECDGRIWYTTQKGNIAFSIGLELNKSINNLNNLTIEIAEIILEVFENLYQIKLQIKHPNDIMINNQKVGGILTETKLQGEIVKYLVIGIGINTNNEEISTSIKKEFGAEIENSKVIEEICQRIGEIV